MHRSKQMAARSANVAESDNTSRCTKPLLARDTNASKSTAALAVQTLPSLLLVAELLHHRAQLSCPLRRDKRALVTAAAMAADEDSCEEWTEGRGAAHTMCPSCVWHHDHVSRIGSRAADVTCGGVLSHGSADQPGWQ